MKKRILFICLLIMGCQSKESKLPESAPARTFYDFDTLEYYKLEVGLEEILNLQRPHMPGYPKAKEAAEERQRKLFLDCCVNTVNDTVFLNQLAKTKKTKTIIDKKYYKKLKSEVFIEKKCIPEEISAVLPIYTDILIFKKENKIIGILKLASLNRVYGFTGAKTETKCFGQNGEIDILRKIIANPSFMRTL